MALVLTPDDQRPRMSRPPALGPLVVTGVALAAGHVWRAPNAVAVALDLAVIVALRVGGGLAVLFVLDQLTSLSRRVDGRGGEVSNDARANEGPPRTFSSFPHSW